MGAFFDPTAFLGLLLMLVGGGVRDLASCLSTDAYWKAKGVAVSFDQLCHDLEPVKAADVSKLIAELDADDPKLREAATQRIAGIGPAAMPELEEAVKNGAPEVAARASGLMARIRAGSKATAVRRLMAIRTLGERKDPKALAVLRPLLDSREMFEADYAKSAIARVEGKSYSFPPETDAERAADLRILPARLDAVAQIAPAIDGAFTVEQMFAMLPGEDARRGKAIEETQAQIIKILEQIGNVRLDGITWGFFAAPPGKPGNAIVVARGQFDFAAFCAAAGKLTRKSTKVEGIDAFEIDDDSAILVSPDHRVVYVTREGGGELELETMAQALRRGTGTFAANPDLPNMLKGIDLKAPLWVAAKFNVGLKEIAGPLSDFDSATLVARQSVEKDRLITDFHLEGESADAAKVKEAAQKLAFLVQGIVAEGRREQEKLPPLKTLVDLAESLKVDSDGNKATLTGTLRDIPVFPLEGTNHGQ